MLLVLLWDIEPESGKHTVHAVSNSVSRCASSVCTARVVQRCTHVRGCTPNNGGVTSSTRFLPSTLEEGSIRRDTYRLRWKKRPNRRKNYRVQWRYDLTSDQLHTEISEQRKRVTNSTGDQQIHMDNGPEPWASPQDPTQTCNDRRSGGGAQHTHTHNPPEAAG